MDNDRLISALARFVPRYDHDRFVVDRDREGLVEEIIGYLAAAKLLDRPLFEWTPLMELVAADHRAGTALALRLGADPNVRRRQRIQDSPRQRTTALILAAQRGYWDLVRLLLKFGADPRIKDGIGRTALFFAARGNDASSTQRLLAAGALASAVTDEGEQILPANRADTTPEMRLLLRHALAETVVPSGLLAERTSPRRSTGLAGALEFLTARMEDRGGTVVAVLAPIEEVSRCYAEIRDAVRLVRDVATTAPARVSAWAHVMQLKGSDWTLVLRNIGRFETGDRSLSGLDAQELSCFAGARIGTRSVAMTCSDDPSATFEVYDRGKIVSRSRWTAEGCHHHLAPDGSMTHGWQPPDGESWWRPAHRAAAQESIYVPACAVEIEGDFIRLKLLDVDPSSVHRLDFAALRNSRAT